MKPDSKDKEKSPKRSGGKVFDVQRPGKAPASPTSRPVILGHKPEAQEAQAAVSGIGEARPLLMKRKIEILPSADTGDQVAVSETSGQQEPMDSAATSTPPDLPTAPDQSKFTSGSKLVLQPSSDSKPDTPEAAPQPPQPPQTAETAEAEPQKTETEPQLSPDEQPAETSSVPEDPALLQGDEVKLEEDPAPEPVIEPLFDDSGVVVSTHDHHRHHALKVVGLLLLILLLAVAALDVALDLGLLTLEGVPHTDFL